MHPTSSTRQRELTEHERRSAHLLARRSLTAEELAVFTGEGHTTRFHVQRTTRLQMVFVSDGQEVEVREYDKIELGASMEAGLHLSLYQRDGHSLIIRHAPSRVIGTQLFLWLPPYRPDYRFLVGEEFNSSSINVCMRTPYPIDSLFGDFAYLRKAK